MSLYDQQVDNMGNIKLKPWTILSGQVFKNGKPDAFARVSANTSLYPHKPTDPPSVFVNTLHLDVQHQTDGQGRFTFKMFAGQVFVGVLTQTNDHEWETLHVHQLNLTPGQKVPDLVLGGLGRFIRAQLQWQAQPQRWKSYEAQLVRVDAAPVPAGNQPVQAIPLGEAHPPQLALDDDTLIVTVDQNEQVKASDIPPGTYDLQISFYAQSESYTYWGQKLHTDKPIGLVAQRIVVPELPAGKTFATAAAVDLGKIEIKNQYHRLR
jgi:hypothetical protein